MLKPILAVTMGDPGGIGPEVIAKALQDPEKFPGALLLLIGARTVFEFLEEELRLKLPLNPIPTLHRDFLREDSVNFLDVTEEASWLLKNRSLTVEKETLFEVGKVSVQNASLAMAALKAGAYQGATGLIDALVTAPVCKEAMRLMEPKFHGHTEYLAHIARAKKFAMMFLWDRPFSGAIPCLAPARPCPSGRRAAGGGRQAILEKKHYGWDRDDGEPPLRVTLVTIHVPLKKVSRLVTREAVLEKIILTHDFLKERLRISKPRIGVASLNPHGRETGEEEEKQIVPAIQEAARKGIQIFGPISGDRIFYEAYEKGLHDAVIAMYHDQALAPFKMVAFDTGVNLTLGLPYIRTSPDHGTAFDIAYQGKAEAQSMAQALQCAAKLIKK